MKNKLFERLDTNVFKLNKNELIESPVDDTKLLKGFFIRSVINILNTKEFRITGELPGEVAAELFNYISKNTLESAIVDKNMFKELVDFIKDQISSKEVASMEFKEDLKKLLDNMFYHESDYSWSVSDYADDIFGEDFIKGVEQFLPDYLNRKEGAKGFIEPRRFVNDFFKDFIYFYITTN